MPLPNRSGAPRPAACGSSRAGRRCEQTGSGTLTTIAYLVHDVTDPAVARRIRMFVAGGASVRLAGFHRREAPASIAGVPVIDLGRTRDAKLAARVLKVMRHVAMAGRVRAATARADVVVARNLEMLALAVRSARRGQRIVYECLDIHRLLLAPGAAGRALRALERRLLRRASIIVTSSPAFRDRYFVGRQQLALPVRIEENRALALADDAQPAVSTPRATAGTAGTDGFATLRIGWFGMLRCRRSLALLRELVRAGDGVIEVLIAGIPSHVEFEDFDRDVADLPGLRYAGRYTAADLQGLYGAVDLAWAIDYFEEGLNSSWLLPNRLYESLAHGAVPVALAAVETGRWLDRHGVGLTVADPVGALTDAAARPSRDWLAERVAATGRLPRALLVADAAACRDLVAAVAGVGALGGP